MCRRDVNKLYRVIGALLIIVCSTLAGRKKVMDDKNNIKLVSEYIKALNIMICELKFRRTPLPSLCAFVSERTNGAVSKVFKLLEQELNFQVMPDVMTCCHTVIGKCSGLPARLKELFIMGGESLGVFDMDGQIDQLRYVKNIAEKILEDDRKRYERFGRTAQTLWICGGIALAVILI